MHRFRARLFPFGLAIVLAVVTAGCGGGGSARQKAENPIPIRVRTPMMVERASVVRASGSVEPRETVKLGFQISGRIARLHVEEGQSVRAGQPIAELDDSDYRTGLKAAEAQAATARATAEKAQAGARKQEVAQAKAAYEQADDEYRRMKQLFERGSLAPNDFHKIELKWRAAKEQYDLAAEGARTEDKKAAEAQLQQAMAGVEVNRKHVDDTRLLAPMAGVVGKKLAESGEVVGSGTPVVALMDLNSVRVRVGVPESEISKIRIGQTAKVVIPSMGGKEFSGKVELVGHAAEPSSRSFPVFILAPNPGLEMKAGMIAEAAIEVDERIKAATLPAGTILRDVQGATFVYVFFPEKGRVYARRVTPGLLLRKEVEIVSGLDERALVVVAGQHLLREGAPVQVEGGAQ